MLESATFWTAAEVFVHEADVDKVKPDKEKELCKSCVFLHDRSLFSVLMCSPTHGSH